jgi:hypothetical protein
MISELLMTYVFDRLDKQILKRLPYTLLISLIAYLMFDLKFMLLLSAIFSLMIFVISTAIFNLIINSALENMLINVDVKKVIGKLAEIFEGKTSLLDDIKAQENLKLITLGSLSGLSLTILLSTAFLMIFQYFEVGKELAIPMIIILLVYTFQDLAETELFKEYQMKETETPFIYDIAETYIVDNSLKEFPTKTLKIVALKILSKIFGPLCHLNTPKIHSDALLVYDNPAIESLIKELTQKNNKLYLKHEAGQSIDNFFVEGTPESLTCLREKSPKEVFPYLFDPNYSYQEKSQKKWTALSIFEQDKVKGYIFIHMFKGVYVKSRLRKNPRRPIEQEHKRKATLLFILIGERKYIKYIKTRIEVLSTKYPQNLMDMELDI